MTAPAWALDALTEKEVLRIAQDVLLGVRKEDCHVEMTPAASAVWDSVAAEVAANPGITWELPSDPDHPDAADLHPL